MLSENSTGIKRLIFDRICRICDEIIIHDPEYKELGKIPSELIRQLMAKLPKEDRELNMLNPPLSQHIFLDS